MISQTETYEARYGKLTPQQTKLLMFPSSTFHGEQPRNEKQEMEWDIQIKYANIRTVNKAISVYNEKNNDETDLHGTKFSKNLVNIKSDESKRVNVLITLFGNNPEITNAINVHDHILRERPKTTNLLDWCARVKHAQTEVVQLIQSNGGGNGNMYVSFTTPLICYLEEIRTRNPQEYAGYMTLFAPYFYSILEDPNKSSYIMACHAHRLVNMPSGIFRALYNDGLLFSSLNSTVGATAKSLDTACRNNAIKHFSTLLSTGTGKGNILKCARCGEHLFNITKNKKKEDTIGTVIAQSARDHSMAVQSAFYLLEDTAFETNLLFLCRKCNGTSVKGDKETIEYLYGIFYDATPSGVQPQFKEQSKMIYKTIFTELARTGFRPLSELLNYLIVLKNSYDKAMLIRDTALEDEVKHIVGTINLMGVGTQTFLQAEADAHIAYLNMFTDIIQLLLSSADFMYPRHMRYQDKVEAVLKNLFCSITQATPEELRTSIIEDTTTDSTADLTASIIEDTTLEDLTTYSITITPDNLRIYLYDMGTQSAFYSKAPYLRIYRDSITRAVFYIADTDYNSNISITEFSIFFYDVANKIRTANAITRTSVEGISVRVEEPTGIGLLTAAADVLDYDALHDKSLKGGFNKGIRKKNKSKITKKLNHRKIKSQKSYRKHTNRLRKHKSFFTKTLKKKI